jgi:hypothetical protein
MEPLRHLEETLGYLKDGFDDIEMAGDLWGGYPRLLEVFYYNQMEQLITLFFDIGDHSYFVSQTEVRGLTERLQLDTIGTDEQLLLLIVLATAARYSGDCRLGTSTGTEAGRQLHALYYSQRALIESDSLATVQAYVLEAEHLCSKELPEKAWTAMFDGVRAAFTLGLHVQDPSLSLIDQQRRAAVWVAVERIEAVFCPVIEWPNIIIAKSFNVKPLSKLLQLKQTTTELVRRLNWALSSFDPVSYQDILLIDDWLEDHQLRLRRQTATADLQLQLGCELATLFASHAKLHQIQFRRHPYSEKKMLQAIGSGLRVVEALNSVAKPSLSGRFPMVQCFLFQMMAALFAFLEAGRDRGLVVEQLTTVRNIIENGDDWRENVKAIYDDLMTDSSR